MADPWKRFRRRRGVALIKIALTQLALLVAGAVAVGSFMAVISVLRASDETRVVTSEEVNAELEALQRRLQESHGELDVTKLQLERSTEIIKYSSYYQIPADLSAAIYDVAIAEGIHPSLGFQLIRVESRFEQGARSTANAIGYAQVRLPTARGYDPDLTVEDLLDRETNLRMGFRFLRDLLKRFEGDLDLALIAYNRGPTLVDSIISAGGDPRNGYASAVKKGLRPKAVKSPTRGS